eukprot:COSAG01_NODE_17302_length_1162_cov_1.158043_2_plen_186_part_01
MHDPHGWLLVMKAAAAAAAAAVAIESSNEATRRAAIVSPCMCMMSGGAGNGGLVAGWTTSCLSPERTLSTSRRSWHRAQPWAQQWMQTSAAHSPAGPICSFLRSSLREAIARQVCIPPHWASRYAPIMRVLSWSNANAPISPYGMQGHQQVRQHTPMSWVQSPSEEEKPGCLGPQTRQAIRNPMRK